MITHKEYMANSTNLHQAYYLEIAKACGISYANSPDIPIFIKALKNGDKYFNDCTNMDDWDRKALITKAAVSAECKKRGTFNSLATGVCVHKAAAREAAIQADTLINTEV